MKYKSKIRFALFLAVAITIGFAGKNAEAKPLDSLRVGMVMKGIKAFTNTVQDSIIPDLQAEEKKKMKEMVSELKGMIKKSENMFLDTMQTDFKKLSPEEKTNLTAMESQVSKIKNALPQKSKGYHLAALAHLPVYRAVQEMRSDGRTPLLETYREPYDPSTSDNGQVIMVGAYLNFYLEYRISVGGMEMGPDIVDPERLVFTFPEKLLADITTPTYIEVKAAPKKQTIVNGNSKFEDHPEQTAYVLVYPRKK